jgi:TPP-dependent pyruvate/acetoin dehydrogenase alpha subunit
MLDTLATEADRAALPPLEPGTDDATLVAMLKQLMLVRVTEETLAQRYREQEMRTPAHFGTGQEAVAVGICQALGPEDAVYSHHRSHNHYLARGGSPYRLAAELYGRVDGCAGGRGGSVHLTAREQGFIVSSAILGETVAVATGSALAFAMDGKPAIAVTFFGEATMEEGVFYEAANYAAIHRLPVLFVCENNLYSTESPLGVRQPSGTDLCERVRSFRIDACRVDGNDVAAVHRAAAEKRALCLAGAGPAFIECMTYRWREHVGPMYDHELNRSYRSQAEVESWMARCPVRRAAAEVARRGLAGPDEINGWAATIAASIAADVERARHAPWPQPESLFDHA